MPTLLESLQAWGGCRIDELTRAWSILHFLMTQGQVPEAGSVTTSLVYTVLGTIFTVYVAVLVTVSRQGRKLVLDVLDTTLATALVFFLVGIVLGLPVGTHDSQM
jgi:hypothetical protein